MRIFSISTNEFSFLVSSYTFCAAISGFLVSFIMDKFDRKKLLIFFFCGFCLGTLACGIAPTYKLLLISRAITGAFGGVLNSVVLSIVSDSIPYEKRGAAMGIVSTAFSLASVAGVPFALLIANSWGWHVSFLSLAALSVVILTLAIIKIPEQSQHLTARATSSVLEPLHHVFQTPTEIWALVFGGCLVLGQFMVIPFLSQSLVANAGMTEKQLPLVYLVGGALTFVTGPLVGKWADIYGKHVVFRYGLLFSFFATLIITHLAKTPLPIILTIVGVFFISVNARWVPALALISGVATPQYRGSFMSFVGCIQQLMAACGAMLAGMIVVQDPAGGLHNYGWVGVISVCVSLCALALSYKVSRVPGG